jgi:hypothetical protein
VTGRRVGPREAMERLIPYGSPVSDRGVSAIVAAVEAFVAEEREACARIADDAHNNWEPAGDVADRIRARASK